MDAEENINEQTCSVKTQFESLVKYLRQADEMESQHLLRTVVEDLLARFVLWAGNLGALQKPTSQLSLDRRLSNAPDVIHEVMRQLKDVAEALEDLSNMVRGAHDDHNMTLEPSLENDPSGEYAMILRMISGSVGSLFKLGVLVRKSITRDRFERALQEPDLQFPPQFDIQHVQERYPKTSISGITTRLGSAISKRRQFIAYCRDHRYRLGEESAFGDDRKRHKEHNSSKATTFHPDMKLTDIQMEESDTASYASASTITDSDLTHQLPSLASLSPDGQPFECPICFTLQNFQRDKSWRATYTCSLCDNVKAVTKDDLQTHLKLHGSFDNHQLETLVQAGLDIAKKFFARDCPFCQEWATKLRSRLSSTNLDEGPALVSLSRFKRHVATHQEQLALFAMPQSNAEDEIEDEDTCLDSISSSDSQGYPSGIEQIAQLEDINVPAAEQLGWVEGDQLVQEMWKVDLESNTTEWGSSETATEWKTPEVSHQVLLMSLFKLRQSFCYAKGPDKAHAHTSKR
ncbi:hypothetical protein NW762_011981 [Fusarium torreyae]|uniref:Oxidoreductase acuF-like C2H2 type zinc-finger domain-containing protein n=1 Tax=Fusarium torreyae TaxID=1237075 RepID=A0A9W8VBR7_9HYPO|nr:hypothetical protein NW762_011981 [Fusarium torreyae]